MVQRKVPNKLGIKSNPIEANKQIVNHKPSSLPSQNHDIKNNRGGVADLKKKMMKKSGKTNFTRHLAQPGKPPPLVHPTPKQSTTSTPNYMKSTSSSVARKEQSQVSSRSPHTFSNSNKSKSDSAKSVNKPTRSLARNSSLKLVKTTLTKTPSFKPVRVTAKKSVRATCSSTLKEAKFPSYLELSPGGTESDGTSVFKVCPYTYCSLNGHHHPPLPPLKCFLSARRRTLKTQRNFKLGCLSPPRADPHGLGSNENVSKQKLNTTEVAPVANEDDKGLFAEIYSKEREEMADTIGRNTNSVDDYNTTDSSATKVVPSDEGNEVAADDAGDNLDRKRGAISAELNNLGFCYAEKPNEGGATEEIYVPPMAQEEADFESVSLYTELEIEETETSVGWDVEKSYAYSEDEIGSIPGVDDSVVSDEFTQKSSIPELLCEESLDKESIISGPCYGYDDSQSSCSLTELAVDECVEASEDTLNISLDVIFTLDGEITEQLIDECAEAEEIFYPEDDNSSSGEECINLQHDDEIALIGYQELNGCNFIEVQDETSKDNGKSSDGNIVVKREEAKAKTDCCEQGNEDGHGTNYDKELVFSADVKSKTNEDHTSHQADDVTEIASGVEEIPRADECPEKANQIKDTPTFKDKKTHAKCDSGEELSESHRNLRGIARRNDTHEPEESREFNPRPPNFLPLEPDPGAEKVDLKHQMMDDRKNAEDWMLDFALRRAVDKLAPARKRKVALLVEAFETVLPTSKWEPHLRSSAAGFAHPRPIQACR